MVKIMSQQRRMSRHNSRQSSIGETTSVCSAKSVKSTGSSDFNPFNNNTKKHLNGINKLGSQESGDSGNDSSQPTTILNVAEMLLHGVADNEILHSWLRSINCEEFVAKFLDAGYDMPTISRITPQDLTAIGVTDPTKRLKILAEIKKLNLQDGIPNFIPTNLSHWLSLIRLDSYYYKSLCDQQIDTIDKLCQLTWEDFEELGITKLGHQKRIQLAIERVKELEDSAKCSTKHLSEPIYDVNPSQILLVASAENHSMNGPIINKQSSTSELSSIGSGSMHSVYSAASTQYQPTYPPSLDNNQQTMVTNQVPNNTNINHPSLQQNQQQHAMFVQHQTTPLIYQQPPQLIGHMQQHQNHYHQVHPTQQLSMQFAYSNNESIFPNNGRLAGQMKPQQNRQSMSQLPFAALAKLPKHQQQILQQSSIYATLRRQPSRQNKQPPPPVPIRTNSLKTNSLTDETYSCQQSQRQFSQQQLSDYRLPHQPSQSPQTSQPSSMQPVQLPPISQHHQFPLQRSYPQTSDECHALSTKCQPSQMDGVESTQCNATTGKDDDFPPPPSPLSLTDSDEHDLVLQNSDNNFSDVGHGMMTFRVGT